MTQAKGKQKQALRAARDKKRKVRRTVWIGGDEDVVARVRELDSRKQRLQTLISVKDPVAAQTDKLALAEVERELSEAREDLQESSIKFVMEAIGRNRYDALLKSHPPTKEQVAEAEAEGESITFNPETFTFAIIDACCVEPEHEPGELEAWIKDDPDEEWNLAEVNDLFQAAIMVNIDRSRAEMGKGSLRIPSSEPN